MKTFALFVFFSLWLCLETNANTYRIGAQGGLNVRTEADVNSKVLGKLQNGDVIEVEEIIGDWALIEFEGRKAYVSNKYLETYEEEGLNGRVEREHVGWFLPVGILVLAFICAWLLGHEYYWPGIGATVILLGVIWFMLACTNEPLWFVTEKGVGIGMMLLNLFLMFVAIMLIWSCIAAVMVVLGVDKVTVWIAKALFALTVFAPDNNLIVLLLLWGVGVAIYRSIKESNLAYFALPLLGLLLCGVVVYWGGALCGETFHGFDAAVLVVGLFPQLLNGIEALGSSSEDMDGRKCVRLTDNAGNAYILTQDSKYSEVYYTDQHGNQWRHDSSGYHPC